MAARTGAGSGTLPALVRKQQDNAAELRSLDKSLLGEVSKRAEQRDAKREQLLHQHRQELAEELARSSARLAAEFPDYADLVNPKPLSLAQAQKLLAPGEALVLCLARGSVAHSTARGDGLAVSHRPEGAHRNVCGATTVPRFWRPAH